LGQEKRIGGQSASRYNSRIVRKTLLAVLFALSLALSCPAQLPSPDAIQEFASRIAALTGPGSATLSARNSSSASAEQFAAFRKALQRDLQDAGVRLRQSAQATSDVRVTLSENARGLVYLAEVQQGSETRDVIAEAPLAAAAAASSSAMTLHRMLLVQSAEPVLDAEQVHLANETKLVLLTERALVLYRQQAGKWTEETAAPITHGRSFPLDLRGHLVPSGEGALDAYLPGVICQIGLVPGLHAECHDADDAWPLGAQAAFFNSAGNSFNGLMRPGFGNPLPPFFSAAALPYPGYTLWIFNGVDGRVRTHDGVRPGTLNVHDWGSDVAAVRSGCGSGTQLLVTAMTDEGANDSLRGFELVERQPVLAAPALEFAGPIMAVWTASDGLSATAVARNTRTGSYEVFNVSMGCNQ
jgi:hypothetical protein